MPGYAAQTHASTDAEQYMLVYYVALYAIVWYDWAVLLNKEYKRIWRADWTLVKFFYLANRYTMLLLTVVVWAGLGMNRQTSNCGVILGFQQAFPILVYFFSGFILVMRCYVIWGRSKVVGAALLLVHIAHVVISGWTLEQTIALPFQEDGPCIPVDTKIMSAFYTCFSALVFDSLASGLALWKAVSIRHSYKDTANIRTSVLDNIIQNGSLYMVGSVLATCLNMSFRFLSASPFQTAFDGYVGGNTCLVITSILSARLALSLKDAQKIMRGSSAGGSRRTSEHIGMPSGSSNRTRQMSAAGAVEVSVTSVTHVDAPSTYSVNDEKKWLGRDSDLESGTIALNKSPHHIELDSR